MKFPISIHIEAKAPNERQSVTIGVFGMAVFMLVMTVFDRTLWEVELFKILLQAVIISGIVNMILSFHYTANKDDTKRTENTGKAFEAITAAANAGTSSNNSDVTAAADAVASAAAEKADEFQG